MVYACGMLTLTDVITVHLIHVKVVGCAQTRIIRTVVITAPQPPARMVAHAQAVVIHSHAAAHQDTMAHVVNLIVVIQTPA